MEQTKKTKKERYLEQTKPFKECYEKYTYGQCSECKLVTKLVSSTEEGVHTLSDYSFWRYKKLENYEEELKKAKFLCYTCSRSGTENGMLRKKRKKEEENTEKDMKRVFSESEKARIEQFKEILDEFSYCSVCFKKCLVGFYLKETITTPNNHPLRDYEYWIAKSEEEYRFEFKKYDILCKVCFRNRPKVNYKNTILALMKELKYCRCGYCYPPKQLTGENLKVVCNQGKITDYYGKINFLTVLNGCLFCTGQCLLNKTEKERVLKDIGEELKQNNLPASYRDAQMEKIKIISNQKKQHYAWFVQENIR